MKLAINGGTPIRSTLFPAQNTIGLAEKEAAARVMESGILTGYQGSWGPTFFGGPEVRALEEEFADKMGVKHAIACNSATSGLFIACGAAGLGQRDEDGQDEFEEVIVTPFSMTCSATAPMGWHARPLFADIERDYYCLDANDARRKSYQATKAIIPVSLFGQPYDADGINANAHERGALVIEDAAQALGSKLNGKYAGTLGDIGVFSFNLGKHLTCGEGGMMVTDDDELAMRCRLIMNHAEAVVNDMERKADTPGSRGDVNISLAASVEKYKHLFGFNLRLPEISAAIMRVQLAKMDWLIKQRVENVEYLVSKLKDIPCLEMPKVRPGATHTYYVLPLKYVYDENHGPVSHRDKFVAAVKAELAPVKDREVEGVPIGCGYIRPISNMPLFDLPLDIVPECTRQWQDELIILHRFFGPMASRKDLDDVANAFEKVWTNREELINA